jgi:hypothetical protein
LCDAKILGCVIKNSSQTDAGWPGLYLKNGSVIVNGCKIYDDQTVKTQAYAIEFETDDAFDVYNCDFRNNLTGVFKFDSTKANIKIQNIRGCVTENSGTTTLTAQSGSVVHGLAGTPIYVWLTTTGSSTVFYKGALQWYPSGSLGFWIEQTGSGIVPVNWKAEYVP